MQHYWREFPSARIAVSRTESLPSRDIAHCEVCGNVGLDTGPNELGSVGEAIMLGADAGKAAAREFEQQRLAGAAAGRLTNELPTMSLFEDDGHVFAGGEGTRAGEQNNRTCEVPCGIWIQSFDRKAPRCLGIAPGAEGGNPAGGAGKLCGSGFNRFD